ncbi:MAG: pyridoxal phosphate-dependent aminotransferase [Gemmatimonadota bacterium]
MQRRSFLLGGVPAALVAAVHPLYGLAGPSGRVPPGRRRSPFPRQHSLEEETRLYANENPYGPPPEAVDAMAEVLRLGHRYGRYGSGGLLMEPSELEEQIAEREGVPADHVLVTHGATELLQLATVAYGEAGVVAPLPTYTTILGYASALRRPVRIVPVRDDFHLDLGRMLETGDGAGLVYLCHPNNPTGLVEDQERLEAFCREASTGPLVVADEAYFEFVRRPGYRSLVSLALDGVDLLVVRTFSKAYGMAGLRVGYGIARPDILQPLRRLQVGPINVVSLVGARAALRSQDFVDRSVERISDTRRRLIDGLDGLGLRSLDPVANFVMADVGRPAGAVLAALRERGVRVNSPALRNSEWIRITVGTDAEIDRFLSALGPVLERERTPLRDRTQRRGGAGAPARQGRASSNGQERPTSSSNASAGSAGSVSARM